MVGRSAAFCLLCGFTLLTGPRLIIQNHLLEAAPAYGGALSVRIWTGRTLCISTLAGRAILTRSGRASITWRAARKLSAPNPAAGTLSRSFRISSSAGNIRSSAARRSGARRNLLWILRRSRGFHALERRYLERHVDRARSIAQIEFLRSALKS